MYASYNRTFAEIRPMTCFGRFSVVLPENTYYLIFLNFFRGDVNLVSSVIVAAEEDPEP